MVEKSTIHNIRVNRISYASRDIEIGSNTPITEREAERIAIDIAGDYTFSEHDAEYEIDGNRKDPPTTNQINAALAHIFLTGLNPTRRNVLMELLASCTGQQLSMYNREMVALKRKKN